MTDAGTFLQAGTQGAGHDVDAVHAPGTFGVVNLQLVAFHPHALVGQRSMTSFLNVELAPVAAFVGAAVGRIFSIIGDVFLTAA
jgi:hypothetical protein